MMEKQKDNTAAATVFIIVTVILLIVLAVKLPQKAERERKQTEATGKIDSMQEQINQQKAQIAQIEGYVNTVTVESRKQTDDMIRALEIKTYAPTADCIEVRDSEDDKIVLSCIQR